jgi:hypothetical protein
MRSRFTLSDGIESRGCFKAERQSLAAFCRLSAQVAAGTANGAPAVAKAASL